jgi:Uma2 family endonuclease/cell division protein FtsB
MHLLRREDCSNFSRNTAAPRPDLQVTALTPPEGGWAAWYLTDEDDMGESIEQGIIIRLLLAALAELARERGWQRSLVASDQFFAWVEGEPLVRVSPDVYVLDDPPAAYPGSWQTWRAGHPPPRFAVEVVSATWKKDYRDAPSKYKQLGARELIIFDPAAAAAPRLRRFPLQVYRRTASGAWKRVLAGPGPVHSVELDAWLVVVPGPRLRIARDPAGRDLVQTPEELVHVLRRENAELRRENAVLRRENAELRATVAAQAERIANLEATVGQLLAELTRAHAETAQLRAETAQLRADLAELRARP